MEKISKLQHEYTTCRCIHHHGHLAQYYHLYDRNPHLILSELNTFSSCALTLF